MRIPTRVLPAPQVGDLPEPLPLRRMVGPSVILVGLSIGSGEFVLWPRLTAEWGFALFWACWVGVTLQFFLNMEIERWSLITGESAVVGFARLHRAFVPIFLVCSTLPWIWPGWATGAATFLEWELSLPVIPTAIAGLLACGLFLSVGPVVYRSVEVAQLAMVALIVVLTLSLAAAAVGPEELSGLARGALQFGHVPEGVHLPMLLGALAFAGAGGSVNLAQSNYIKDKGYGMGALAGRITSPFTGREEATGLVGTAFRETPENLARWRVWWRRANVEHFASFYLLALLSLALFSLLAAALLEPGAAVRDGFGFIEDEASVIGSRFGSLARHAFLVVGIAVLLSTELALIDAVARVAADLLLAGPFRDRGVSLSKLYFAAVWLLIGFGIAVLVAGFDEPLLLLVLSASLNGVVMFLYSGLLLWLNFTSFDPPLRPSLLRILALAAAFLFFGYFSVATIADRIGG